MDSKIILRIKSELEGLLKIILAHKVISVVAAAVILSVFYYAYNNAVAVSNSAPRYVLTAVQQGTFIASIAGTGQVSASIQLNIQPQVSGTITSIDVTQGQKASAGDVLVRLDPTTAEKTVRNAQISLQSAKLSLQQLEEAPTQLSITQDQNAITQAEASQQTAQANLSEDYENAFNNISGAFVNMPGIISGLNNILFGMSVNPSQTNADAYNSLIAPDAPDSIQFERTAVDSYYRAVAAYNQNLQDYNDTDRNSSTTTISSLLNETYVTSQTVAAAVKDAKDFLDLVVNTENTYNLKPPSVLTANENSLQTYTSTIDTDINNLLGQQNTLQNDASTLNIDTLSISVAQQTLQKLLAGPDPLSVQAQQLSIQNAQNNLTDAEQQLAYYTVRAPFDGVVASLPLIVGDQASAGTTVATMITAKSLAVVQLNEVDAAKLKLGDEATMTFPAIPNLTIAGTVSEIDTIGTVSQGVVTYNVQVAFDAQNTNIKPGMSVSAAIVTNVESNVLLVPNSAIQSQGTSKYVQVLNLPQGSSTAVANAQGVASATPPTLQTVQVGDSNNTETVITSGLKVGDMIVSRTISGGSSTVSTQTNASGGGQTVRGGFGGGVRVLGF